MSGGKQGKRKGLIGMTLLKGGLLFALLLVLFICQLALAQQEVTVSALLQHPDQYDGKVISVKGTITAYRERTSARGNDYTTFRIEDGASVSVFAWKHQGLHNGMRVRVTGTFAKIKQVGRYTFHNEIQAQGIAVLQ